LKIHFFVFPLSNSNNIMKASLRLLLSEHNQTCDDRFIRCLVMIDLYVV